MGLEHLKSYPYPTDVSTPEKVKEYLKLLYWALSEGEATAPEDLQEQFAQLTFIGLDDTPTAYTTAYTLYRANSTPDAVEECGATLTHDGTTLTVGTKVNADITSATAVTNETRFYDYTITMTADPAASAEISAGYFALNKTGGSNGVYILNGLEGVARSSYADEAGTFRGVYGRTYTSAGATATMRTAIGGEFSARAGYSGGTDCVAESGTAFVGSRIWMAPYFTSGSLTNINNFWGLWIYGEHATQINATSAIKISDAGGGFTTDITLQSGETISNAVDGIVTISGTLGSDEIRLTPKASSSGPEGTVYYDSDDDHVYVGTE